MVTCNTALVVELITMLQAALAPAITPAVLLGFMERIDDWTSSGPAVWSPEYAVRWRFVCVHVRVACEQ